MKTFFRIIIVTLSLIASGCRVWEDDRIEVIYPPREDMNINTGEWDSPEEDINDLP